MAGRYYMVPTGGDTGASLTTRPSEMFSLAGLQDKISSQTTPTPGPCNAGTVERNRALLQSLQEENKREWQESDSDLHQRIRWQKKQWASGSSASNTATDATSAWHQLNHAVPPAFRFHDNDDVMPLHWTEGSLADKNALVKPTPSWMLNGKFNIVANDNERPTKRQKTQITTEQPTTASSPLVLTISVYSRRLKRSTRASRQRLAAEQRLADHQRESNDEDDSDATTVQEPLFESGFGLGTDDSEENNVEPAPTQVLEIRSDQTLADLCDAIYCRVGDLPERDADSKHYTGRKLPNEDPVLLIEDVLYSHSDIMSLAPNATRNATPLAQVPLSTIPALRLQKPYYYQHHGLCEHLWTIDEVRVVGVEPLQRFPLTTYLATYAIQHPLSTLARTKASDTHYPLATCFICDRYSARYLIVGGANGNAESTLPHLKEQVTPMCPSCLAVFGGQMPEKKAQRKQAKTRSKKGGRSEDDMDARQLIDRVARTQAERTELMRRFMDQEQFVVVPLLE